MFKKRSTLILVFVLCAIFLAGLIFYYFHFKKNVAIRDPFGRGEKVCSILEYGAKSDDPLATQKAFEKAFAVCSPGGTVRVPDGEWMTGAIHIPSDTTLYLSDSAVLSFTSDPSYYLPAVPTRFEGLDVMNFSPLIYARDSKNISIIGRGKLIGNGSAWWNLRVSGKEKKAAQKLYDLSRDDVPLEERIFASIENPLRPAFVEFYNCENIYMEGLTVEDGPMWTIHPVYSKNIKFINLNIKTTGPNTDGIALDSVDTAIIKGGNFSCGDDCIVIKSGTDYDGWKQNKPSKNIRISNVTMNTGNGGVTIGSEMSGGVEDVVVENSSFNNIDSGIRIKSTPGRGGYVRNIIYRNITMNNVKDHAIQINAKYSYATVDSTGEKEPVIENIVIDKVVAKGVKKSFDIKGLDSFPIRALKFSNISIESNKDKEEVGRIQDISDSTLDNVVIKNSGKKETLIFGNFQNVFIKGSTKHLTSGMRYAKIQGENTKNVHLLLKSCKNNECVSIAEEVDKNAIISR